MGTPHISKKVDYGLRAMVRLAQNPPGSRMSFRDIAACERIPDEYLAKILRSLVVAELLQSSRGARGGYRLAMPPGKISVLEIIEALDGPVALNQCQTLDGCPESPTCTLNTVFDRAQMAMVNVFRTTSLQNVLPDHPTMPMGCDPLH
jgi:Rrf2 family protein